MADAYLLDTNIASIVWDGENPNHYMIRQWIAELDEDSISVCSITIGEFEYGLRVSPAIDEERHRTAQQAMLQYYVWQIDRHTGIYYGQIRGELFKRYAPRTNRGRLKTKHPEDLVDMTTGRELGIQENDLWIVSLAVQYDLRLITSDKKMQHVLDIAAEVASYQRALIWTLPEKT